MDETPQIEVRPIEPEDYDGAVGLIRANLGEYDAYDGDADTSDLEARRMDDLYDEPRGRFWVAVADGAVVGTIGLERKDERVCQFRRLSVHSDFRRHDVARQLALKAEEWAREAGFRRALVEITTKQKPAQVFLQTGGYQEFKRALRNKQVVIYYEKTL